MIETRSVVCRYGETIAVDGVSLSVDRGEYVAVVGPNGSGKTTLVRTFNGLETPDSGDVLVDDTPVEDDLVAARQAVGMVFQEPRDSFVAATIRADVAFGPRNLGLSTEEIHRRIDDALAAVNLEGRGDERIDELSGGERERVAIAGALAMDPDYLVLDEPLTGLDEPARRAVCSRLAALHEAGTAIIVVTHDLRGIIDDADRVVGMDDGRVVFDTDTAAARDALAALDVYVPPVDSGSTVDRESGDGTSVDRESVDREASPVDQDTASRSTN